jgi:5-methylcytosine-specific restriction endonuclease McrA
MNNSKLSPTFDKRCGTTAGYAAHRRRNENSCRDCQDANNVYAEKWRNKNKTKVAISNRKSRLAHPERVKRNKKLWRKKNLKRSKEMIDNARKKNPEKYAEIDRLKAHKRRARKKLVESNFYTEQQVLDIYGSLCHICGIAIDLAAPRRAGKQGWEMSLHIDHLCPISKGGSDTLANVRPSHAQCNLRKGAN